MLHTINIVIHVAFGTAALLIGLVTMLTMERLSIHRRYGRWFLLALLGVVFTAALGVVFFRSSSVLVILTLISGYVAYSGYRVIRLRNSRPKPADTLISLAVLIACLGYGWTARNTPGWSPAVVYPTLGALFLVAGYDLLKYSWLFDRLKSAWLYEHIYKMLSAYNALLSAFLGTVFPHHKPYSQLGPTVLFLWCSSTSLFVNVDWLQKQPWLPCWVYLQQGRSPSTRAR